MKLVCERVQGTDKVEWKNRVRKGAVSMAEKDMSSVNEKRLSNQ
jgi:hypothetical protein